MEDLPAAVLLDESDKTLARGVNCCAIARACCLLRTLDVGLVGEGGRAIVVPRDEVVRSIDIGDTGEGNADDEGKRIECRLRSAGESVPSRGTYYNTSKS